MEEKHRNTIDLLKVQCVNQYACGVVSAIGTEAVECERLAVTTDVTGINNIARAELVVSTFW